MATRRVHLCRGGLLNGHRGLSPAIGPEGFRHHQLEEVASNPTVGNQLNLEMTDSRWPAQDGWVKMARNVKGVEIHYVKNLISWVFGDFKVK